MDTQSVIRCKCCEHLHISVAELAVAGCSNFIEIPWTEGKHMYWRCKICSHLFQSKVPTQYCEKCTPVLVECKFCKRKYDKQTMLIYEKDYYCRQCNLEYFRQCRSCHAHHLKKEMKNIGWKGVSEWWVCSKDEAKYFLCTTCRTVLTNDYKGPDGIHCSDCHSSSGNGIVTRYNSAGFRPIPKFIGEGPFYGIELEVDQVPGKTFERDACIRELGRLIVESRGTFYLKSDGSLHNGIEIVSHPISIYEWDKQTWLGEACQLVKDFGGGSFNTETCGLHVHRGKKDLTDIHLSMLVVLFIRLQPYFERFAQRRANGYCHYAFFDEKGNQGKLNGKVIYKTVKDAKGAAVNRYQAINLQNIETIECRIFRGTLFTSSILAYIHFLHLLCEFVKDRGTVLGKLLRYSVPDLWDMVYEYMSIDPFVKSYMDEKEITKKGTKAAEKVVPIPREV